MISRLITNKQSVFLRQIQLTLDILNPLISKNIACTYFPVYSHFKFYYLKVLILKLNFPTFWRYQLLG